MSALRRIWCDDHVFLPMPAELVELGLPHTRSIRAGCPNPAVAYLIVVGTPGRAWNRIMPRCRAHLPNRRSGWEYVWRQIAAGEIVVVAVDE